MDFIHIKAPGNWINDPNGFIYFKGKYHIFYQYFPYEPMWGTMHWGHAVSTDLVNWEHKGIAIYPSKAYDMNGVFSGNALIKDDKLYLYYTGIRYPNPNPDNIHVTADGMLEASQVLMVSEDGESFDNLTGKVCVIPPSINEAQMSRIHTRDPKVWYENGKYIMILGSSNDSKGRIIFLESADAVRWELKASYESKEFGDIFECPDLFTIDNKRVMFTAATDYIKDGLCYEAQEIYKFVDFDPDTCSLSWNKKSYYLDYGMDLYATQTTPDENGDRVFVAWLRMPIPKHDSERGDWSGQFCMPRTIKIINDRLFLAPHKNVDARFTQRVSCSEGGVIELEGTGVDGLMNIHLKGVDNHEVYITKNRRPVFKLSVDVSEASRINIGGYLIYMEDGCVAADRSKVYPKGNYRTVVKTPKLECGNHLDIYVTVDTVEIYANGGEYVLTNVIYRNLQEIEEQ